MVGSTRDDLHRLDVWWADVPGDKRRPVMILTRERFIPRLTAILVAPVTSSVRQIPTEVVLDDSDGMPTLCAANFDNVFTIHVDRLVQRITRIDDRRNDEICAAHRFAAGC